MEIFQKVKSLLTSWLPWQQRILGSSEMHIKRFNRLKVIRLKKTLGRGGGGGAGLERVKIQIGFLLQKSEL